MRTKTLLLAAALSAAGAATSLAQPVYSQNTVGYVNLTLGAGFSLIANPLKAGDNSLSAVLPSAPNNARIFKFAGGVFLDAQTFITGVGWFPDATVKLPPGEGAFIQLDAPGGTLTFVGEVQDGASANAIPAGYSIRASVLPIKAPLGKASDPEKSAGPPPVNPTTLRFPAVSGDIAYFFNPQTQTYKDAATFLGDAVGWFPPDAVGGANGPVPEVGESFFVFTGANKSWDRNFSVSP